MEDFGFFDSRFEELDHELKYAREHPFKVNLEFDRRFRVWQTMIHRNRQLHVRTLRTDPVEQLSLTVRYVNLDIADAARLSRRAVRELLNVADDVRTSSLVLIMHQNLLQYRVRSILVELKKQLSLYEDITGVEIIHHFINGWKELKESVKT